MMRILALALSGALLAGAAAAQTSDGRQEDPANPPKSPPTMLPLPPDKGEGSGSSMSDRLSKSQGVIQPPQEVDPAMKQETPSTGPNSMPVIPPPGTPGGDPSVKPK
jgi:hypothetical protein